MTGSIFGGRISSSFVRISSVFFGRGSVVTSGPSRASHASISNLEPFAASRGSEWYGSGAYHPSGQPSGRHNPLPMEVYDFGQGDVGTSNDSSYGSRLMPRGIGSVKDAGNSLLMGNDRSIVTASAAISSSPAVVQVQPASTMAPTAGNLLVTHDSVDSYSRKAESSGAKVGMASLAVPPVLADSGDYGRGGPIEGYGGSIEYSLSHRAE